MIFAGDAGGGLGAAVCVSSRAIKCIAAMDLWHREAAVDAVGWPTRARGCKLGLAAVAAVASRCS